MQDFTQHKLAAQRQKGELQEHTTEREHEEEWAHAKQAAEQKREAVKNAQERAKAAQQQAAEDARRQWADAEAANKRRAEERIAARHRARETEYAKDQRARQAREAKERQEEMTQESQERKVQQSSLVQPERDVKEPEYAQQPNSENEEQQTADIEAQVRDLKMKLMTGAKNKEEERKAMEKQEAEEQKRSTGSLRDIQTLGKHITEEIELNPDSSSPAPTAAAVTVPAQPALSTAPRQDPSWGNLISFMESGGATSPSPVNKAKYKAAEHAQQLALSRADREAEKQAMQMAEKRAMGVHHLTARQAAANVLGGMSNDDDDEGSEINSADAAISVVGGKDNDSSAMDADNSEGKHAHSANGALSDKNFDQFLAHYKQTQAKEKQFSRLMKEHMADEKDDEKQVAKLRKEKEASDGDESSSLLKVAEVLGSVGASGFLSSAMGGSKKMPKTLSAGSGAALAKRAMAKALKVDPAAASEDGKGKPSVSTVWSTRK